MNSKCIFRIKTFAFCFVSVVGLTACGGGSNGVVNSGSQVNVVPPPSGSNVKYGAVYSFYSNRNDQLFSYSLQRDTQAEVRHYALSVCRENSSNSSCRIEATFTNCVALAQDNRIHAYATGDTLSNARSSALAQCRQLGGTGCSNIGGHCTTPVTPQTSKVGGSSNETPDLSPTDEPSESSVRYKAAFTYAVHSDSDSIRVVGSGSTEETEAAARSSALSECETRGSNNRACRVEFTYTNCFAQASGHGSSYYGFATGNNLASARSSALAKCRELGGDDWEGNNCTNSSLYETCVDPITPQTTKVGGFYNTTYGAVASVRYYPTTRNISGSINENSEVKARHFACLAEQDCRVEFTFTNCVAEAWDGETDIPGLDDSATYIAVATGNTLSRAESSALAQCRRFGRSSKCRVGNTFALRDCNIPITPQPSKVTGFYTDTTPASSRQPPPTEQPSVPSSISISLQDDCNDGSRIDYRFFAIGSDERKLGQWPGGNQVYYTPGYGERSAEHNLSCRTSRTSIDKICYGARPRGRSSYWGVDIDYSKSCDDCCYRCPSSGRASAGIQSLICP